jgi:hypothetical protein
MFESIEFHREMILLQVIGKIPQFMLLLPGVEGDPEDLKEWMVIPLNPKALDPKILASALPKMPAPREPGLRVYEVVGENSKPREEDGRSMPVPFMDLVLDLREATLEYLFKLFHPHTSRRTVKTLRIFRRSWEVISGQPQLPLCSQARASAEFMGIWKNLRPGPNGEAQFLKNSLSPLGRVKPSLLVSVRNSPRDKRMLLYGFRGKWANGLSLNTGDKIDLSDLDEPISVPNPFYQLALHAFAEAQSAFRSIKRPGDENGEEVRDQAFLQLVRKERLLEGVGEYRKFSIRLQPPDVLRISLSLGNRPFLQQVGVSPTFIYWDLKKYPVHIFFQFPLTEFTQIERGLVTNAIFFVESNHPSIFRHAFVRRYRENSRVGTICTEATSLRILNLLRSGPSFDPVVCLLEQMRAAGRILKYGVRERDQHLQQYNPFTRVEWKEYQKVVNGWDEARRFAQEKRADIIPYER